MYDAAVIGSGAAGLMAAGYMAQSGLRVCLIEKNSRPGRKLMITGKGRCNLTNDCDLQAFIASVPTNGRFLYSALTAFPPQELMAFFERLGVPLKVERGRRVFPVSDKAVDIVDALSAYIRRFSCTQVEGEAVSLILEEGGIFGVKLEDGRLIRAERVVMACGGASYPATGSDGSGYRMAEAVGHQIVPLKPSLVPLVVHDSGCRDMMGLSLKNVRLRVWDQKKDKLVFQEQGEMLFTHFGVSGPLILSASSRMRQMEPRRYRLEIDMKPALSLDQLETRLLRDFQSNSNRDFINTLSSLLPKKMIPFAVSRTDIPAHLKCNSVTREQRRAFCGFIKCIPFEVQGFRSLDEAIVTSGGVQVRQVDPKTMESKLVRGLFFAGEILDVDAYTGGYNLQIAFSTGRLAAQTIAAQCRHHNLR